MSNEPSAMDRIAEVAGAAARDALIGTYGGQRVYLPAQPAAEHSLSRLLGTEAARAICSALGPGYVSVPRFPPRHNEAVGREVLRLSADGLTAKAIAARLKLDERTVYRWRARARRG